VHARKDLQQNVLQHNFICIILNDIMVYKRNKRQHWTYKFRQDLLADLFLLSETEV